MRQRALCVIIVTILGAATFQACSPAGVPRQAEDLVAEAKDRNIRTVAERVEDANTMCLNDDRFKVQVAWETATGQTGMGSVVPAGSDDSGLFWFFDEDNVLFDDTAGVTTLVEIAAGAAVARHHGRRAARQQQHADDQGMTQVEPAIGYD